MKKEVHSPESGWVKMSFKIEVIEQTRRGDDPQLNESQGLCANQSQGDCLSRSDPDTTNGTAIGLPLRSGVVPGGSMGRQSELAVPLVVSGGCVVCLLINPRGEQVQDETPILVEPHSLEVTQGFN